MKDKKSLEQRAKRAPSVSRALLRLFECLLWKSLRIQCNLLERGAAQWRSWLRSVRKLIESKARFVHCQGRLFLFLIQECTVSPHEEELQNDVK